MNGDQTAIAYFFAAIIIFAVAFLFGLLEAICEHPWLLLFIGGAVVIYILARRAERRERGGMRGDNRR